MNFEYAAYKSFVAKSHSSKNEEIIYQFKRDSNTGPRPTYLLCTGKVAVVKGQLGSSPNRDWNLHNCEAVTAD